MKWKKRLLVSLICGVGLTGLGLGLTALGGYGACGPACRGADIGAYLSVDHALLWFRCLPALETWLMDADSVPLNMAVLVAVPIVHWTIAGFILLSLIAITRKPVQ